MSVFRFSQVHFNRFILILGPFLGVVTPLFLEITDHPQASFMLGIALWMALWWMTEAVPLPVTALIPLISFPLAGIATAKETAPRYMTSTIFLFLGGFLIAQAMERTGLHRRVALLILSRCHTSLPQMVFGFACSTAFLSMWVSNTATTMLMTTIALAVLSRMETYLKGDHLKIASITLLLTIAYAANIGGMGTPVGTVPNLVFLETMKSHVPKQTPSFLQWMVLGLPVVFSGLAILYFLLARHLRDLPWSLSAVSGLKKEILQLAPMEKEEKMVAWVLSLTALAWMSRQGISGDHVNFPGWASFLPHQGIDDGTVAIFSAFILFLVPMNNGERVLGRDAFTRLPWGILILLGGGFALAMGMQRSGLSASIGSQVSFLNAVSPLWMMLGIAFAVTFLTEITSNTATTQVLLPILAALALGNQQDITLMLATATLSASCAFMLPVATPPNAIVFGTERIPMQAMMRAGFKLNLIMPFVIVFIVLLLRSFLPT